MTNISQLKRITTRAIRSITPETIRKVWKNLENRLQAVIRENGGHIERLETVY